MPPARGRSQAPLEDQDARAGCWLCVSWRWDRALAGPWRLASRPQHHVLGPPRRSRCQSPSLPRRVTAPGTGCLSLPAPGRGTRLAVAVASCPSCQCPGVILCSLVKHQRRDLWKYRKRRNQRAFVRTTRITNRVFSRASGFAQIGSDGDVKGPPLSILSGARSRARGYGGTSVRKSGGRLIPRGALRKDRASAVSRGPGRRPGACGLF